ncbi:hypothetical protein Slala05_06360 [Streptomyces lavendulae subsp. lavendulae]|nr:hypothetical protein Slala05_06360 [Streptomyces lavendulae subsp. lavendulae]
MADHHGGVVDQHVHPAQRGVGRVRQLRDAGRVREVRGEQRVPFALQRGEGLLGVRPAPGAVHGDPVALPGERGGDRPADAPGGSGDEDAPAGGGQWCRGAVHRGAPLGAAPGAARPVLPRAYGRDHDP